MLKPPPIARLLRELADIPAIVTAPFRGAAEIGKLAAGEPVLVLPGFLADDKATSVLRHTFEAAGFATFGWERGFNLGIRGDLVDKLIERLRAVSAAAGGQKVILIGWSLGGLYAREIGHKAPDLIRMIVTLGSPFSGDLHANHAWRIYQAINDHTVTNLPIPVDFINKPPVRTIAVWSPLDGVVTPETSKGSPEQSDEQVEMNVTHMGFAASKAGAAAVVKLVAERL